MKEHDATEQAFKNGYAKAAREIFEDIENKIGFGHDVIDIFNILDELKQKYTKSEK